MTLAITSRVRMRQAVETTFGVIPVAGNNKSLRIIGESLKDNIVKTQSKEIRNDRQISDLILSDRQAAGGIQFELSYKEYDDFIEAALQGSWATNQINPTSPQTITATITLGTTVTASAGTPFLNIVAGQWLKFSGFSTPANNGYFQVASFTSSTVLVFAAATFTNEGPTSSVIVSGSRLTNGTTNRSFTLEKEFNDVAQFIAFRGMTVGKLALQFGAGQVVTGSIDFNGKDGQTPTAVTAMPGVTAASQTFDVMNCVSGIANILEGGVALVSTYAKSLSFEINNNLRDQDSVGNLGAIGVGSGQCMVTGKIDVYFADATYYNKFTSNTNTSLSLRTVDSSGNGYIWTFPKVRYSDATVVAGGINQDVMASLTWEAIMDATTGKTIIVDRVGA